MRDSLLAFHGAPVQTDWMKNSRPVWYGFAVFALLGAGDVVRGQLAVEMKLEKNTYVSYEAMEAEVTVYNRSGRDQVLGGPAGTTWLRFQVKDIKGNLLSPTSQRIAEEPILVKAGGRVVRKIDLTTFYPVYEFGTYRVRASAYLPPLEQYYESQEEKVNVSDGKVIWEEVVGAPPGYGGPYSQRRFSLLTYRGEQKTELYVRVRDEQSGGVYATFSLGAVILFHRPQAVVDQDGRLNVLYLGAPQVFAHTQVGFDGELIGRNVYRADGYSKPILMLADGGGVRVRGGRSEAEEANAAASTPGSRRLSDRPSVPGFGGR